MNKVIISGNLARDPESSVTNSGVAVCRFTHVSGEREQGYCHGKSCDRRIHDKRRGRAEEVLYQRGRSGVCIFAEQKRREERCG